jgi:hypothetical protein
MAYKINKGKGPKLNTTIKNNNFIQGKKSNKNQIYQGRNGSITPRHALEYGETTKNILDQLPSRNRKSHKTPRYKTTKLITHYGRQGN